MQGDLDDGNAEAAENFHIQACIALHCGEAADDEDGDIRAALVKRPGHDEAVASVVARTAQDGGVAILKIIICRFECGDDLPPRVLHEHHRRNPNLFNRLAIGVSHLSGIQHAHLREV